jgi:hypothetical protein
MSNLDYAGILEELNNKGIKYIVCGGIAVNLLGIPRMTYDLDLLVDMKDENLEKLLNLLKTLGFKPKVPVDIMDFAERKKRDEWVNNKAMKAFNLINPDGMVKEIDIVIDSPVSYDVAIKNAEKVKFRDTLIPVICAKDLIKMKKKANRQQDYSDIRYLEKIDECREKE